MNFRKIILIVFVILIFGFGIPYWKQNKDNDNPPEIVEIEILETGFVDSKYPVFQDEIDGTEVENYSYFPVSSGQELEYVYRSDQIVYFAADISSKTIYIIDDSGNVLGTTKEHSNDLAVKISENYFKIKLKNLDATNFGAGTKRK